MKSVEVLGHMSSIICENISAKPTSPQLLQEDLKRLIFHYGDRRIEECRKKYMRAWWRVLLSDGYTISMDLSEWPASHRHFNAFEIEVVRFGIVEGGTNLYGNTSVVLEKNQTLAWEKIEELLDLVYQGRVQSGPVKAYKASLPPLVPRKPGENAHPLLIEDEGHHVQELISGLMRPPERELKLNFPYTKCRRNIDKSDWIQLRRSVKTSELKGFVHREQIKDPSSLNFERVLYRLTYSGMASVYYVSDDSGVDLDIGDTLSSSDLTIVILNPNIGDNFIVGIGDRNLLCDGEFAPSYFFTTPNDLRIPTSNLSDVNN